MQNKLQTEQSTTNRRHNTQNKVLQTGDATRRTRYYNQETQLAELGTRNRRRNTQNKVLETEDNT